MVCLRPFTAGDVRQIQPYYPERSLSEIEAWIADWATKTHDGKYFEMLAVVREDRIVGLMGLSQHTSDAISVGPEIYPPFRRQGLAYEGLMSALQYAAGQGYRIAVAQVRKDNAASIALHRKAGFEVDHECVTRKGNDCYFFMRSIG